jgi:hypothetical protein
MFLTMEALTVESNLAQPSIDELTHSIQSRWYIRNAAWRITPTKFQQQASPDTSSSSSNELKQEVSQS